MKKIAALIVVLALVLVTAAVGGGLLTTPPAIVTLEPFSAQAPNGESWVVENRLYAPCVYRVDAQGKILQIHRTTRMPGDYQAVTALASSNELLYYTRQAVDAQGAPQGGWSVWQYNADEHTSTQLTEKSSVGMVKGLSVWQSTLWVTVQNSQGTISVYELPEGGGTPQEAETIHLPEGQQLIQGRYASTGTLVALLDSGARVEIVNGLVQDGAATHSYGHGLSKIVVPSMAGVQLALPTALLAMGLVTIVLLLLLPLVLLYIRGKQLLYRVWSIGALGVLVTYLIAIGLVLWQVMGVYGQASQQASLAMAEQLATVIGQQNPASLADAGFVSSTERESYRRLLGVQDELLVIRDGTAKVGLSQRTPSGMLPIYDQAVTALVEQAMQGENGATYSTLSGRLVTVSACGVYASGQLVGVLVMRTGMVDAMELQSTPLTWLAMVAVVVLLLVTLALRLVLGRVTAPITEMTQKMEAITAGDMTVWQPNPGGDELDDMRRAMQEMCMSLAIRDYEVDSTISSYNRFVPMGLDRLLDRASIQEVTTGDVRTIVGTVGLLSVSNREIARAGFSDDEFVHFVNSCCNILSKNLQQYGGYLLSSAFDLASNKIFFEGTDNKAVAAGLELTTRLKQSTQEGLAPSFSLLLHNTGLLYGIAGGHDKVFPFISSAELEFLQSYNEQFRQAGVRLVITEKLTETLESSCQVRYIGFVSSADEGYFYKLYEVLSVYSDTQRTMRVRYDDRLQEGIQLFYRSDFYLARTIFSSLLRMEPNDGIVRWYLSACEYYFNCKEQDTIDFRLFGIDQSIT